MNDLSHINFDTLTPSEFSDVLPELMASTDGKLSEDPRLTKFLAANPDAAGLVRDLEAIAEAAKGLFDTEEEAEEPSDSLWSKIASKLGDDSADPDDAVPATK